MTSFVRSSFLCLVQSLFLLGIAIAQPPGPTPEHEQLKAEVGTWDAKMKLYETPTAEPTVSDAVEVIELLPGGMWILSKFDGQIMGMPYSGHGVTGYDPAKKKFVGTWVDSMSPHLMTSEGEYDPATKTITSFGESRDPVSGETIKYKQISRAIDENSRTFEMLRPDDKGEYVKMMEIEYTRREK